MAVQQPSKQMRKWRRGNVSLFQSEVEGSIPFFRTRSLHEAV